MTCVEGNLFALKVVTFCVEGMLKVELVCVEGVLKVVTCLH